MSDDVGRDINIRDIARLSGVSISTVSRVINGYRNVNEETREKVSRIIAEKGYAKKNVRPAPQKTVGIIMPLDEGRSINAHPTLYNVLSGLTRRLSELSVGNTLLMPGGDNKEDCGGIINAKADAFIIFGTRSEQEDEIIPRLIKRSIPVIVVNRWIDEKRISYVNIDDTAAAFQAVERLIKLGHRKIGIVNGDPQLRNSQLRFAGYKNAMDKYGVPVIRENVIYGKYNEESGKSAAFLIDKLPVEIKPTAVFTTSDVIALGMQKCFIKLGYRLPDDMSMIGFGDIELAEYINPPLTTIRIPAYEMGVQAAELASRMLSCDTIRHIKMLVDSKLIVRGSDKKLIRPISGGADDNG